MNFSQSFDRVKKTFHSYASHHGLRRYCKCRTLFLVEVIMPDVIPFLISLSFNL